MISYLQGEVLAQRLNYLIVTVQGVGYKVFVPISVIERYTTETNITLYTHQHVREDILELYGFLTIEDLELFEQLISVSGIGPKAGLTLLSQFTARELINAITQADVALLTKVSGVGKKTAERLILELKGKFTALETITGSVSSTVAHDVLVALESLGYSTTEAVRSIKQIDRTLPLEQQVKAALTLLGQKRRSTR